MNMRVTQIGEKSGLQRRLWSRKPCRNHGII